MKRPLLILVLLALNGFALRNFTLLSRNMLFGTRFVVDQAVPQPLLASLKIPKTPLTLQMQAAGRIGSDFAQIYFPAQAIYRLQDAFVATITPDPFGHPSRYAPFVILFCAATLCRLDFGIACFLDLMIQLLLFYLVLFWAFRQLGIMQYFLPSALLANLCLFLTPVGLSWFERGQFSLYVGVSYMVLLLGLMTRKPALLAFAALLAFVKWTSFPAIAVIFSIYLINSKDMHELKKALVDIGIFSLVILLLFALPALFAGGTSAFLNGLVTQELQSQPSGLSLARVVPRSIVKLLPLGLILLGYINVRVSKAGFVYLIPYSIGVGTILILYPTLASDYSMPALMGFIPFIIYWGQQFESPVRPAATALVYAYLSFILIASYSTQIADTFLVTTAIYLGMAVIFLVSPLMFARYKPRPASVQTG